MATSRRLPRTLRRAEIADAILRLIGSRGVSALTMAAVAAEVGVTSGALFRHFATRDEMLEEAARRAEEILSTSFPPAELPPLERLDRFVLHRAGALGDDAALAPMMLSEQLALALPPAAKRRLRAVAQRTLRFVVEALRDAASRGEVRADVPPEDLALLVLGAVQTISLTRRGAGVASLLGGRDVAERVWSAQKAVLAPPPSARTGPRARRERRRG